jgi:hypothetical protein
LLASVVIVASSLQFLIPTAQVDPPSCDL